MRLHIAFAAPGPPALTPLPQYVRAYADTGTCPPRASRVLGGQRGFVADLLLKKSRGEECPLHIFGGSGPKTPYLGCKIALDLLEIHRMSYALVRSSAL